MSQEPGRFERLAGGGLLSEREQIAALRVEVHHLADAVRSIDRRVAELTNQANRWKGGFLVVLSLGGLIGTVGTIVLDRLWR